MYPSTRLAIEKLLSRSVDGRMPLDELRGMVQRKLNQIESAVSALTPEAKSQMFFRAGLHQLQGLVYKYQGDLGRILEEVPAPLMAHESDWELIAHVATLGELAVGTAQAFISPQLKDISSRWKDAGENAEQQIAICEELQAFLSTENEEREPVKDSEVADVWQEDYFDQRLERIIPIEFLKENGRPNCLGKGIVLAAVFQAAGVNVLGLTPITPYFDAAEDVLNRIAELIDELTVKSRLAKPDKLKAVFSRRAELAELRRSTPERFHMGVVVPLSDGRYYLIDPHMRSAGVFAQTPTLKMVDYLVDWFSSLHPGVAVLHNEYALVEKAMYEASMAAGEPIDAINQVLKRWDSIDRNPYAAIPLLAQTRALELLLEHGFYVPEEEAKNFLGILRGDVDAKFLLVRIESEGMQGLLSFRTSSGQELSPEMHTKLTIAAMVINFASGGKLFTAYKEQKKGAEKEENSGASPAIAEALAEGMNTALSVLFSAAFKRATKGMHYGKHDIALPHPLVEIYEPWFRIGVEMIAHANAISACDEGVVMDLAGICGGQFHVSLAAAEPLRTGESSELSSNARALLEQMPARLRTAEQVLSQLNSMDQQPTEETATEATA